MCRDRSWGTSLEMVLAAILFNVRVVSFANKPFRLWQFCSSLTLLAYQYPSLDCTDKERTVYLYCHKFKDPLTPYEETSELDHFAYLKPCELNEIDENKFIYYGDMTPKLNENEEDDIISITSLSDSLHIKPKKDEINIAKKMLEVKKNIIESTTTKKGETKYTTILRSSSQCEKHTLQKHSVRPNESQKEITVRVPRKQNIFRTRNITKRPLDDNDMTRERDTTLIRQVQTFPLMTRKQEFDKIVLNWDINVDESTKSDITECAASGYDYLNSTYELMDETLHGSYFAFRDNGSEPEQELIPSTTTSSKDESIYRMKQVHYNNPGEKSWWNRACIVYFKLHRQLGKNSLLHTSRVYGVRYSTISNWFSCKRFISTWFSLVTELKFNQVLLSIPKDSPFYDEYQNIEEKMCFRKTLHDALQVYRQKITSVQTQLVFHKHKTSHQKLRYIAKKNDDVFYLKKQQVRIHKRNSRPTIFREIHQFIKESCESSWERGIPMTRDTLKRNTIIQFSGPKLMDYDIKQFFKTYVHKDDRGKALNTFICRSLDYCGFTARKSTVCQKIPPDWRKQAFMGALRVRESLRDLGAEIILSADETFVKFHETTDMVLAPTGSKNVGTALKTREKSGCTVMVTLDMIGNRALPPFLIFSGKFGKTNMKKYNNLTKATVVFTQTHWMTVHTMKIYFKYLSKYYPKRKIGIIIDSAPTHLHEDLKEWIKIWNTNPSRTCEFYVEFIDPSLTSIYQPPDVCFNKPLKQSLRSKYFEYVSSLAQKGKLQAGDSVHVHRDLLIDFIVDAFNGANENWAEEEVSQKPMKFVV